MSLDEVLSELRRLNEPVPKPFRLPTETEVNEAEKKLGIRFHPDYRKFLLVASDVCFGTLEPGVVIPDAGHQDLFEIISDAREMGVPGDVLPFCADTGDYFCMDAKGQVIYWSHNGKTDEQWPNLETWIAEVWIGESE